MASCVYQKYTLKLVVLAVCIPGIQQVACVFGVLRNSRRYVRLDIIQRNLRRKWRLSAKTSADFLYEKWITCTNMYHLFKTNIFYHLNKWSYADIAIFLSPLYSFINRVFLAVRFGKWRKSKKKFNSSVHFLTHA